MDESSESAKSNLASLQPSSGGEISYPGLKNSLRLQGSMRLFWQRAHRLPEGSRPYLPGDPVQLIDWKAYARTDELIIRQKREEASSRVAIVLQHSSSMAFPEKDFAEDTNAVSKRELGFRIGMHLAYLHVLRGDEVEFWFYDPKTSYFFAPKSRGAIVDHFSILLQEGFTPQKIQSLFLEKSLEGHSKYDQGYWLGDALEFIDDAGVFLQRCRYKIFMHLLSSWEADISWVGDKGCYVDFPGMMPQETKEFFGNELKRMEYFNKELRIWREDVKAFFKKKEVEYGFFTERTPLQEYFSFLEILYLSQG